MNAIAVVKAEPLAELADPLADRLRRLNPSLPVHILDARKLPDGIEPQWTKAWLWDLLPKEVERVICCEADVFPLRAFPPIPETAFAAARELKQARDVDYVQLRRNGMPFERVREWFNTGVFVASRQSVQLFEDLKKAASHPASSSSGESAWTNILAYRHGYANRLPAAWNFQRVEGRPAPADAIAFRFGCMPVEPLREAIESLHRGEALAPAWERKGSQWLVYPEEPWPNRVTFAVAGPGLGDICRSVQYACHIHASQGVDVQLYCRWHGWPGLDFLIRPQKDREALAEEIRVELDTAGHFRIVRNPELTDIVWLQWFRPWHFPLIPFRTRWRGYGSSLRRKIAYQLDGVVDGLKKNPPPEDLARLQTPLPGFEWVRLDKSRSVRECVEILADADAFFGVDSGMMQLAYAVGVPAFLIKYRSPTQVIFCWHRDRHPVECTDTHDFFCKLEQFLGLEE